jgi:beta-mannanase
MFKKFSICPDPNGDGICNVTGGKTPAFWFTLMVLALACICSLAGFSRANAQESVYNGAYVHNEGSLTSPSDWQVVTNFESDSGKTVSIINFFIPWEYSSGFSDFPSSTLDQIRAHGSMPLLTWQPNGSGDSGEPDSSFTLTNIINGNFDDYITTWALAAKAWGNPFFLRFAHEMNGNWYPWAESINGNQSGQYVKMWRHVHDIFTQIGATNVTWVWCVNTDFSGSTPITGLYPGDNYVDWISLDSYNRLTNTWGDFSTRSDSTLNEMIALAPGKPIMIAETGCSEKAGHSKGQWFTNALANYVKWSMPRIKAWCYFNNTNQQDGNDWRITTSTDSLAGYESGIGLSYYSDNKYGSISNSPIQPLLNDAQTTDTMGPFVSIVNPAVRHVRTGSRVEFDVTASDKSGMDKIVFSTNGVVAHTENLYPYQYFWTAPASAGQTTTITAKAYDTLGNTSVSTIQVVSQDPVTVNLTNNDASGSTSFDTAGNWDSGQLPTVGNDYIVGAAYTLRTPADNQAYVFAGDSLTLAGTFSFKQTNVITINNLQLTNALVGNFFAGGSPDTGRIAGNINVITNAVIDGGGNSGAVTSMQILAAITGSGGLTIQRPNMVILSASNSYNGPVVIAGSTLELDGAASLTPSSLTLMNYFSGTTGFNTVTNIVLAGGNLNVGNGTASVLRVGYRNSAGTNCIASLDVASQSNFTANVGEFSVGINLFNDSLTTLGSVSLATNNLVTATNILIGDSTFTGGGTNFMTLGGGNDYFNTPAMTVGGRKESAQLNLPAGGVFQLDNGVARTDLTIGVENFGTSVSTAGTMALSGGRFIASLGTLTIGLKAGGLSGGATGLLTLGTDAANNMNVNTMIIGSMTGAASGSPSAQGTLTFDGGNFLVNSNVTLGSFSGSFGSAAGTLNLNGGTFMVAGNIAGGGGASTVNVNGGILVLAGRAGASGSPLTALNLTNAFLHLNLNGNLAAANIVATTVAASGTTVLTVDSITNVSGTTALPLVSYAGTDPFSHLTLAALPAGYTGNLVDNVSNKRIDLNVASSTGPPPPTILLPSLNGTNLTFYINSQSGFDYVLEMTPQLAPASWAGIQTNAGGGTLTFAIPVNLTNPQRFFRISVQ